VIFICYLRIHFCFPGDWKCNQCKHIH
jgi:hypothetical protein